jgi:predicted DNA-binding protein
MQKRKMLFPFMIDATQYEWLRAASEKVGKPMSVLIRKALEQQYPDIQNLRAFYINEEQKAQARLIEVEKQERAAARAAAAEARKQDAESKK